MNCFFPLCFFLCELFYFCVSFLVNQKCATVSLTLSTQSCWKGAMENITRNTLVHFLSSTFSVSVVMPHQLSANLTRIGPVTHELQPYKTWLKLIDFLHFISMLQEDLRLANKFLEVSTFTGPPYKTSCVFL